MTERDQYRPSEREPELKVSDALVAYLVPEPEEQLAGATGETRLSGKNQLTVPAAMVRALGWRPGDTLELTLQGEAILLEKQPQTPEEWARRIRGPLSQVGEWATDKKIDAWVRAERESWERE